MAKKDYREKIEEDRQQIEVESELSRLSRSKHKAKKRKSPLISILLVTFILIPLSLLVYVKFFYEPTPALKQEAVDNEKVQMETNNAAKKQQEKEDQEAAEKQAAEKEKQEQEAKLAADEKAKKEAELAAAKKAEEEAAAKKAAEQKAAQEAAAKQQQQQQQLQQPSSKSHTVQPGDTLYSIAMKYYGDPNAVEKIRVANGLGTDSISTGRTLVLP